MQLLELDKKAKLKASQKQNLYSSPTKDNFDEINLNDHSEVDQRLKIYEAMRQEILKANSQIKEQSQQAKMKDLDSKIKKLEQVQKEREEKQRQEEERQRSLLQQRENKNKNFLDNIKTYSVEDI